MAEVILLERVNKLGSIGDVVRVKDGYARNFLLPRKKALRATKENREHFENKRSELEKENSNKKTAANDILSKVDNVTISLIRQAAEDGRLFGSVTSRDIAISILDQVGVELDRSCVELHSPIKAIGIYEVKLVLHAEVSATIKVNIARTENEAKEAEKQDSKK
ncbi:MAG: 50S ribosomal protein L9 [Alphaproteobacteria bacterium]